MKPDILRALICFGVSSFYVPALLLIPEMQLLSFVGMVCCQVAGFVCLFIKD